MFSQNFLLKKGMSIETEPPAETQWHIYLKTKIDLSYQENNIQSDLLGKTISQQTKNI